MLIHVAAGGTMKQVIAANRLKVDQKTMGLRWTNCRNGSRYSKKRDILPPMPGPFRKWTFGFFVMTASDFGKV